MRYYILFLFLAAAALAGCQSIDVERYLNNRYCPQAFVLKGAEVRGQAELARLELDCDVLWQGEIGHSSFMVKGIELEVDVNVRLRSETNSPSAWPAPKGSPLKLFANIVRSADKRIIARQTFVLTPRLGQWKKQVLRFDLPQKLAQKGAEHIILVGFLSK